MSRKVTQALPTNRSSMSSQTKEIVTERTDAARSVHRPGEESSKLKPGSCEELGKASVKVRPRLVH